MFPSAGGTGNIMQILPFRLKGFAAFLTPEHNGVLLNFKFRLLCQGALTEIIEITLHPLCFQIA